MRAEGSIFLKIERMLEIAVIPAALGTIPLTIAYEQGIDATLITVGEWAVWSVFLAEYTMTVLVAADRWGTARRHWLHAVVVILSFPLLPSLLSFVQLARLAPVLRLLRVLLVTARGLESLRLILGRREVVYVAAATAFLVLGSAGIMTELEPETVRGTLGNAIWWALVTVSTVGYGDIVPSTPWGRVLGLLLMITGIGLVSTLAASVSAYFVGQEKSTDLEDIARRLERIEALLQERAAEADPAALRSEPRAGIPAVGVEAAKYDGETGNGVSS